MPGSSNLAVFMFSTCFFISGILKVAAHNFMKSRSRDGLAAKGLLITKVKMDSGGYLLSREAAR